MKALEIESQPFKRSSKNSGNDDYSRYPISAQKILALPFADKHGDLLSYVLCDSSLKNNSFIQKDCVASILSNEIDRKSGHCDSKKSQLQEKYKMHDLFLVLIYIFLTLQEQQIIMARCHFISEYLIWN